MFLKAILNQMFSSVFTVGDLSSMPNATSSWTGVVLDCICVTPAVVETKLHQLRLSASLGSDGLHPKILKDLIGTS